MLDDDLETPFGKRAAEKIEGLDAARSLDVLLELLTEQRVGRLEAGVAAAPSEQGN